METKLPDHHQVVLDRFVAACEQDERIVAAFLGGSYAEDRVDRFSDLDLFFVTSDEAYEDFIVERETFVRLLGDPLLLEDFGLAHGYCAIFANGTECDLWFGGESSFHHIYGGPYVVLLDRKNLLTGEALPVRQADHSVHVEILRQQIDWFWHELSHFIKAMGRGQLWFAYGQLEMMRQICMSLARLRHNFHDIYAHKEPYFKVEYALPVEQLSPLETTFCPMEYEAMLQACYVICQFYQGAAPELAKAHDMAYQTDLEQLMMEKLARLSEPRPNS
jgi:hypothetical protein